MKINRRKKLKTKPMKNRILSEKTIGEALKKSAGIQTAAGKMLGISQSAISQRISGSEYLQNIYSEIREEILDLAESKLLEKLNSGHMTAIIFLLKCLGKSRGYTEKSEVDISQKQGSGVLLVPGVSESVEAWQEMIKKQPKAEEQNHEKSIH
jgi:predicted transcriptional regulator